MLTKVASQSKWILKKKQLFSGDLLLIDRNTYHLELRRDSEELTYFLGIPEEIINQWAKEKSIYFKKNAVMSNLLSHQGNSKNDQHTSFLLRTLGHNTTAESFQRLEQEFKQKKARLFSTYCRTNYKIIRFFE